MTLLDRRRDERPSAVPQHGIECIHEADVVQSVLAGRWPDVSEGSLGEHAEGCELCREVAEVAGVLGQDRRTVRRDVRVPVAGQVWWRAAVRARLEATQAAARPMAWLYTVLAAAVGVGTVLTAAQGAARAAALLDSVVNWFAERTPDVSPAATLLIDVVTRVLQRGLPLVIALTLCLLAAPIALYLALRDE
jgi:hypothetical protein